MLLRVAALVTLALLGAYHLMRVAATACTGGACDFYIPLSLLLPVMILIAAAVSGVLAIASTQQPPRPGRLWLSTLSLLTVISVAGPIISLALLRDSPDAFIVIATILVALAPIGALVYSFTGRRTG